LKLPLSDIQDIFGEERLMISKNSLSRNNDEININTFLEELADHDPCEYINQMNIEENNEVNF
jgi:hypothetical protein